MKRKLATERIFTN